MKRFAGIDVAMESHDVVVVDEKGEVVVPSFKIREDSEGHSTLLGRLQPTDELLIVLEATGHYWVNLYAALVGAGYQVAVVNALQSRRFAQSELLRAKTDKIDALALARFALQKRPQPTPLPDQHIQDLRELVRFLDVQKEAQAMAMHRLWRMVDLCFTEIRTIFKDIGSEAALAVLEAYPTAAAMRSAKRKELARLTYGRRKHKLGSDIIEQLLTAAPKSVASKKGPVYENEVRCLCEDIRTAKRRIGEIEDEIDKTLHTNELAQLLLSIDGLAEPTVARLIGHLGDPAKFKDGGALGSYVGVVPATSQSGRSHSNAKFISHLGNSDLRRALWMTTLAAIRRKEGWLGRYYRRLRERGKPAKVALTACMRKLLIAVHWVATHRQPFVDLCHQGAAP
jgi:transposase